LGGSEREIDDASGNEGAAVGDADESAVSGLEVGDAHDGTERKSAMRGGHGVHVVDFAVRSTAVVVGRAVPAGESGFGGDGLGAGGEGGLGEVRGFSFFVRLGGKRILFCGGDVGVGPGCSRLGGFGWRWRRWDVHLRFGMAAAAEKKNRNEN